MSSRVCIVPPMRILGGGYLVVFLFIAGCSNESIGQLPPVEKPGGYRGRNQKSSSSSKSPSRRNTDKTKEQLKKDRLLDVEIRKKYGRGINQANKQGYFPLHEAAMAGDLAWIQKLSEHSDFDPNQGTMDSEGLKNAEVRNALFLAKNLATVKLLLQLGTNPQHKTRFGNTVLTLPYWEFKEEQAPDAAKLLVDHGLKVTAGKDFQFTFDHQNPKLQSFFKEQARKEILAMAPNVKQDKEGNTRLHLAIQAGFDDLIEKFLREKKDDLNTPNKQGYTPMMEALSHRQYSIAEKLLTNGADPSHSVKRTNIWHVIAKNSKDQEAIDFSEKLLKSRFKSELVKKINLKEEDFFKNTPLELITVPSNDFFLQAAIDQKLEEPSLEPSRKLAQLLFKNGARGKPIEMIRLAAETENFSMMEKLLQEYPEKITANFGSVNLNNNLLTRSLLIHHIRSKKMHDLVARYMPSQKGTLIAWSIQQAKSLGLVPPLHVAARNVRDEMVSLLLDNGAPVNQTYSYHGTPLDALVKIFRYYSGIDEVKRRTKEAYTTAKILMDHQAKITKEDNKVMYQALHDGFYAQQ